MESLVDRIIGAAVINETGDDDNEEHGMWNLQERIWTGKFSANE